MILAAGLMLASGAAAASEQATLAAVDACVAATNSGGVDEARLLGSGWKRVASSPGDKNYDTFTQASVSPSSTQAAIVVHKLPDGQVCGVLSQGAYAPLMAALRERFGEPKIKVAAIAMWNVGSARVLVNAGASRLISDRIVSITFAKEVSR